MGAAAGASHHLPHLIECQIAQGFLIENKLGGLLHCGSPGELFLGWTVKSIGRRSAFRTGIAWRIAEITTFHVAQLLFSEVLQCFLVERELWCFLLHDGNSFSLSERWSELGLEKLFLLLVDWWSTFRTGHSGLAKRPLCEKAAFNLPQFIFIQISESFLMQHQL